MRLLTIRRLLNLVGIRPGVNDVEVQVEALAPMGERW